MAADKGEPRKIAAENRKARFNYEVLNVFEAGIVLTGTEIKSAREGRVQLRDAYADIIGGEVWLLNAHFSPYSHGNIWNHEPTKKRKLLLHKAEIHKLETKGLEKGLTLVPLKLYLKEGRLKCELGLCRGKKLHDKRETEKQRDWNREKGRLLKQRD